ncbi:MAG: hypothetical protein K9M75_01350 [Phycisphaerae bacterium]|nr:hypothetical protein [Phycisphaerae bacterium]
MKTYLKIISVSLALLSIMFFFSGCYKIHKNPYEHQPLVGPGKTAKAETAAEKLFFKGIPKVKFRWHKGLFNTVDPLEVINSCEEYLESNGFEPEYMTIKRDKFDTKAHPWEHWTIKDSLGPEDLQKDEAYLLEKYANQNIKVLTKLHVIVCLKPLVVVSIDKPVAYDFSMKAFNGGRWYDRYKPWYRYVGLAVFYKDSGESFTKRISYIITDPEGNEVGTPNCDYSGFYWQTCRGYGYGTRIPYEKDIKWFSPELDVLPTAPEFVSVVVRRIKVPWGWLVLEHKGDEWIVKGVKK